MLQRPLQRCQGEMPNARQISISYYGNSHGPDCGANMAAKGELQQPSCVCLCGFTDERRAHVGTLDRNLHVFGETLFCALYAKLHVLCI